MQPLDGHIARTFAMVSCEREVADAALLPDTSAYCIQSYSKREQAALSTFYEPQTNTLHRLNQHHPNIEYMPVCYVLMSSKKKKDRWNSHNHKSVNGLGERLKNHYRDQALCGEAFCLLFFSVNESLSMICTGHHKAVVHCSDGAAVGQGFLEAHTMMREHQANRECTFQLWLL